MNNIDRTDPLKIRRTVCLNSRLSEKKLIFRPNLFHPAIVPLSFLYFPKNSNLVLSTREDFPKILDVDSLAEQNNAKMPVFSGDHSLERNDFTHENAVCDSHLLTLISALENPPPFDLTEKKIPLSELTQEIRRYSDNFVFVNECEYEQDHEVMSLGDIFSEDEFVLCPTSDEMNELRKSESFENMFHLKINRKNIFYRSFRNGFTRMFKGTSSFGMNRDFFIQTIEENLQFMKGYKQVKQILNILTHSIANPDHPASCLLALLDFGIGNRLAAGLVSGFINAFVDTCSRKLPNNRLSNKNIGWTFFQLRKNLNQMEHFVELIHINYKELKNNKFPYFTKTSDSSTFLLKKMNNNKIHTDDIELERFKAILEYFFEQKNVGKDLFNSILLALGELDLNIEDKLEMVPDPV